MYNRANVLIYHLSFDTQSLSAPKDIDEKEVILRYGRKRIDRKLIKITAKELARVVPLLVREACKG